MLYIPVISPWTILLAAMIMTPLKAALKIAFWPKLSKAKLSLVLSEAFSYLTKLLSYSLASYSSLLKYLTVS
jgi:hypothetical protein